MDEDAEQENFEAWASDYGRWPKAIERTGTIYHLMQTQSSWIAWKARAASCEPAPGIVSDEMLLTAVKKACELSLFPRGEVNTDSYIKHWDGMKQCLQAALDT